MFNIYFYLYKTHMYKQQQLRSTTAAAAAAAAAYTQCTAMPRHILLQTGSWIRIMFATNQLRHMRNVLC